MDDKTEIWDEVRRPQPVGTVPITGPTNLLSDFPTGPDVFNYVPKATVSYIHKPLLPPSPPPMAPEIVETSIHHLSPHVIDLVASPSLPPTPPFVGNAQIRIADEHQNLGGFMPFRSEEQNVSSDWRSAPPPPASYLYEYQPISNTYFDDNGNWSHPGTTDVLARSLPGSQMTIWDALGSEFKGSSCSRGDQGHRSTRRPRRNLLEDFGMSGSTARQRLNPYFHHSRSNDRRYFQAQANSSRHSMESYETNAYSDGWPSYPPPPAEFTDFTSDNYDITWTTGFQGSGKYPNDASCSQSRCPDEDMEPPTPPSDAETSDTTEKEEPVRKKPFAAKLREKYADPEQCCTLLGDSIAVVKAEDQAKAEKVIEGPEGPSSTPTPNENIKLKHNQNKRPKNLLRSSKSKESGQKKRVFCSKKKPMLELALQLTPNQQFVAYINAMLSGMSRSRQVEPPSPESIRKGRKILPIKPKKSESLVYAPEMSNQPRPTARSLVVKPAGTRAERTHRGKKPRRIEEKMVAAPKVPKDNVATEELGFGYEDEIEPEQISKRTRRKDPTRPRKPPTSSTLTRPDDEPLFEAFDTESFSTEAEMLQDMKLCRKRKRVYNLDPATVYQVPPVKVSKVIGPNDVVVNPWLAKIKMESDYIPPAAVKEEPFEEGAQASDQNASDLFGGFLNEAPQTSTSADVNTNELFGGLLNMGMLIPKQEMDDGIVTGPCFGDLIGEDSWNQTSSSSSDKVQIAREEDSPLWLNMNHTATATDPSITVVKQEEEEDEVMADISLESLNIDEDAGASCPVGDDTGPAAGDGARLPF